MSRLGGLNGFKVGTEPLVEPGVRTRSRGIYTIEMASAGAEPHDVRIGFVTEGGGVYLGGAHTVDNTYSGGTLRGYVCLNSVQYARRCCQSYSIYTGGRYETVYREGKLIAMARLQNGHCSISEDDVSECGHVLIDRGWCYVYRAWQARPIGFVRSTEAYAQVGACALLIVLNRAAV